MSSPRLRRFAYIGDERRNSLEKILFRMNGTNIAAFIREGQAQQDYDWRGLAKMILNANNIEHYTFVTIFFRKI